MIVGRKERPCWFQVPKAWALERGVDRVPGVLVDDEGVWCARDALESVARVLEFIVQPEYAAQFQATEQDLPGIADYNRLFAPRARPYQPLPSYFMACRAAALNCEPCRSGKVMETLGAATLVGARRIVVATMSAPKLGWAEDIARWLGETTLILDGRGGRSAWWFCVQCMGRGLINDRGQLIKCPACLRNGKSLGWMPPRSIVEALEIARFVISNYDILIGQKIEDASGAMHVRPDLEGWLPLLGKHVKADTLVLDEFQHIGERGWRRTAVAQYARNKRRVWAASATPTDGRSIKLYSPLDLITGGLFGKSRKSFAIRYSGAKMTQYGLEVPSGKKGRTVFTDTELPDRLRHYMIRRERREIQPYLPLIDHHVIRLQAPNKEEFRAKFGLQVDEAELEKALDATARYKIPFVVDGILEDLRAGNKVACFSRRRDTGESIYDLVSKRARSTREVGLRIDPPFLACTIGKNGDARVAMMDAFSRHEGAALIQFTIDAGKQGGRSLVGIAANHFPDLHWDPTAIQQCEERGLVDELSRGIVSVFYALEDSSDDDTLSVLIPKLESLQYTFGSEDALRFREVLSPKETFEEIWARHTAHLKK